LLLEPAPKNVPLEKKTEVEADEDEFEVKKIPDLRKQGKSIQYLARWKDYGP